MSAIDSTMDTKNSDSEGDRVTMNFGKLSSQRRPDSGQVTAVAIDFVSGDLQIIAKAL